MDAIGTATVKLAPGGGTILKLKAADGTLVLNQTFFATIIPDPEVFKIYDLDHDQIKVSSYAHIGEDYTIHYGGNIYVCNEAIPAQQQPNDGLQTVVNAKSSQPMRSLEAFFAQGNLKSIDFASTQDTDFFLRFPTLQWTQNGLNLMYWRRCYSYILCSVIGAFEHAYQERKNAIDQESVVVKGLTIVLTGVKGTGKSVLGTFIALVLAKGFNWAVHYQWGNLKHSTPVGLEAEKVISISDLSTASGGPENTVFELIVSSCNKERWKHASQQSSFAIQGNLVIIDTVPLDEIVGMGKRFSISEKDIKANMKLVGGVTRLCMEAPSTTKRRIDDAITTLDFVEAAHQLEQLSDAVSDGKTSGTKVYPGLLVHVLPTDPFRNEYFLQASSKYAAKSIVDYKAKSKKGAIKELLQDLIAIPKGRGLAGWIWEPLFTKEVSNGTSHLLFQGCGLPITTAGDERMLFQGSTKDIEVIEFKNMGDFLAEFSGWCKNGLLKGKALMAKAIDDNFISIDAILVFGKKVVDCEKYQLIVAGQQMTVAQTTHELKETGIVDFCKMVDSIRETYKDEFHSVSKEVWFTQPEECLDTFGFSKLQPLKFDAPRYPNKPAAGTSMSGRKRRRPQTDGDCVSGQPKSQSNNPTYWLDSVRQCQQFVAIAAFAEEAPNAGQLFATRLQTKLRKLRTSQGSPQNEYSAPIEPALRTWESTMNSFKAMEGQEMLAESLIATIKADLEDEKDRLEALGWKTGENLVEQKETGPKTEKDLVEEEKTGPKMEDNPMGEEETGPESPGQKAAATHMEE